MSPLGAVFLVALAMLAGLWVLLLPKAPSVDSLTLDRASVVIGEPVSIKWSASNAKFVRVTVGGSMLLDRGGLSGSQQFIPSASGTVLVEAVAVHDGRQSVSVSAQLVVNEPELVPDPQIVTFKTAATEVNLGEPFLIEYKFNEAVIRATLAPTGEELNLRVGTLELVANLPGQREYTLVAENAKGKAVRKSIKVNVVDASHARFVVFDIDPKAVDPAVGRVTVTWQFTNAVRVELFDGTQKLQVEATEGRRDFLIDKDTTFTMTAYDSEGRTTVRSLTAKMAPPPDSPATSPTTAGGG